MSAELAILSQIKQKTDIYATKGTNFNPHKQIDISGIFPMSVPNLTYTDVYSDLSGKSWYKFLGNCNDESTLYNGVATALTYGIEANKTFAKFDGVLNSSQIEFNKKMTDTPMTYTCWINLNSNIANKGTSNTGTSQSILSACEYGVSTPIPIDLYFNAETSNNTLGLQIGNNTSNRLLISNRTNNTITSFINNWNMVTFTYDGSKTFQGMKLYLNGKITTGGTETLNGTYTANSSIYNIRVGQFLKGNIGWHEQLNGKLYGLRSFSKVLSDGEVFNLYNETKVVIDIVEPIEYISTINNVDPFDDNSGVALYNFENNTNDIGGNYSGTATNVTYGIGKFGQCGVFSGSSSSIATSLPAIPSNMNRTFSIWANIATLNTLRMLINGGTVVMQFDDTGLFAGCQQTNGVWVGGLLSPLSINTFDHYCVVFNVINLKITSYKNSVKVNEVFWDGTQLSTGSHNLNFGSNGNAYYFSGLLDQTRIFNKALSQDEINILYNERITR